MRTSLQAEFGNQKPRIAVLDDDESSRTTLQIELEGRGFEVATFARVRDFFWGWRPGFFDAIIADWELSSTEHGHEVLEEVRKSDWEVPFVLLSGRLDQTDKRANVLESLLDSAQSRFVERGDASVTKACDAAEELLERRDPGLLQLILPLRHLALGGKALILSSGSKTVEKELAEIVATSAASRWASRPLHKAIARRRGPAK